MNEIANTNHAPKSPRSGASGSMTALDGLAMQAQMFSCGAAMNLLQLGRVLTEAKPLVPHGQWIEWVRVNAHLPARTAQQYMQAYTKFGLDNEIAQLGPTQIIKLLPMSDEEREELLSENDVSSMTTRELDEAIRAQKERLRAEVMQEAQREIDKAEDARERAEKRAMELEAREPEIPAELTEELRSSRAEVQRLAGVARDAMDDAQQLRKENARLERDMKEQEEILQSQQEALNSAQSELLNLKSAQARGESERRAGDELTIDVFTRAVREFIGLCARMPYMHAAFSAMPQRDKMAYAELLRTIEGWAEGSRQALNSDSVEGGFIDG